MKNIKPLIVITLLLIGLNACQNKKAPLTKSWILSAEASTISIITTKNNKVAEVSDFTIFSGHISETNYLEIEIDLNSLETNIPIRNERMSEHLFQTNLFPTANIHTQLKPEDLTQGIHTVSFDVDLHGVSGILEAEFMVYQQYGKKVITLHKPLIVNAVTFGLEQGITTLKNIAKLKTIDFTVPINLVLTFEPK